jgi:hypothetical protein
LGPSCCDVPLYLSLTLSLYSLYSLLFFWFSLNHSVGFSWHYREGPVSVPYEKVSFMAFF